MSFCCFNFVSVVLSLAEAPVMPGKLVNHPLSIAVIHVVMGGAPGVMWQKLLSASVVLMVRLFSLFSLG